jgi:DNA-binding GntR family transcriptional regulator
MITLAETIQLYQMRKLIEPAAVIQFKNQIDSMRLLEYAKIFAAFQDNPELCPGSRESVIALYKHDIAFHLFLTAAARNGWLNKIFGEIMQHTYRIGIFSVIQGNNHTHLQTCAEHHRIIQAVLMEDDGEIEQAFLAHINRSRTSSLTALQNAGVTD